MITNNSIGKDGNGVYVSDVNTKLKYQGAIKDIVELFEKYGCSELRIGQYVIRKDPTATGEAALKVYDAVTGQAVEGMTVQQVLVEEFGRANKKDTPANLSAILAAVKKTDAEMIKGQAVVIDKNTEPQKIAKKLAENKVLADAIQELNQRIEEYGKAADADKPQAAKKVEEAEDKMIKIQTFLNQDSNETATQAATRAEALIETEANRPKQAKAAQDPSPKVATTRQAVHAPASEAKQPTKTALTGYPEGLTPNGKHEYDLIIKLNPTLVHRPDLIKVLVEALRDGTINEEEAKKLEIWGRDGYLFKAADNHMRTGLSGGNGVLDMAELEEAVKVITEYAAKTGLKPDEAAKLYTSMYLVDMDFDGISDKVNDLTKTIGTASLIGLDDKALEERLKGLKTMMANDLYELLVNQIQHKAIHNAQEVGIFIFGSAMASMTGLYDAFNVKGLEPLVKEGNISKFSFRRPETSADDFAYWAKEGKVKGDNESGNSSSVGDNDEEKAIYRDEVKKNPAQQRELATRYMRTLSSKGGTDELEKFYEKATTKGRNYVAGLESDEEAVKIMLGAYTATTDPANYDKAGKIALAYKGQQRAEILKFLAQKYLDAKQYTRAVDIYCTMYNEKFMEEDEFIQFANGSIKGKEGYQKAFTWRVTDKDTDNIYTKSVAERVKEALNKIEHKTAQVNDAIETCDKIIKACAGDTFNKTQAAGSNMETVVKHYRAYRANMQEKKDGERVVGYEPAPGKTADVIADLKATITACQEVLKNEPASKEGQQILLECYQQLITYMRTKEAAEYYNGQIKPYFNGKERKDNADLRQIYIMISYHYANILHKDAKLSSTPSKEKAQSKKAAEAIYAAMDKETADWMQQFDKGHAKLSGPEQERQENQFKQLFEERANTYFTRDPKTAVNKTNKDIVKYADYLRQEEKERYERVAKEGNDSAKLRGDHERAKKTGKASGTPKSSSKEIHVDE